MRVIVIISDIESAEMPFDGTVVNDSEALHELLCRIDPGDTYTVSFTNREERES